MISFGRIRSQKGPSKTKTLGLGIRQLRQVYIRIVIKKTITADIFPTDSYTKQFLKGYKRGHPILENV